MKLYISCCLPSCSDPSNIRLIGGATHCAGELQMNLKSKWKPVDDPRFDWNLRTADVICRWLNCGSAVSAKIKYTAQSRKVWKVNASYVQSESVLRKYASMMSQPSSSSLEITCTGELYIISPSPEKGYIKQLHVYYDNTYFIFLCYQ